MLDVCEVIGQIKKIAIMADAVITEDANIAFELADDFLSTISELLSLKKASYTISSK